MGLSLEASGAVYPRAVESPLVLILNNLIDVLMYYCINLLLLTYYNVRSCYCTQCFFLFLLDE